MKPMKKAQLFLSVVFAFSLAAASAVLATSEHGTADTVESAPAAGHEAPAVSAHSQDTGHAAAAQEHGAASVHSGQEASGHGSDGGGGHDAHASSLSPEKLKDLFWRTVNFIALVFILVKFGAKPIGNALSGRQQKVRDELEDLQTQRDEAERSYKEFEARLAGMEKEMETVVARAIKQAEAEKVKILEDAERAAEDIRKQAESAIRSELNAAKVELQNEAAAQASVMAEELIVKNLTPDDHIHIIENYLDRVGAAQ